MLISGTEVWDGDYKILAEKNEWRVALNHSEGTVQIYHPSGDAEDILIAAKLEYGIQQTLAYQDEDGDWVLNDPADHDLQYALCSQYSPITGEWIGSQRSNPNLLDNWYFADPVNQRGQAEYTAFNATQSASTYTIDRFKISATAGCSITCKVEDDGVALTVTPPAGKSGQANFLQILAPNVLPPGVYTLSWLYSSDCLVRPFVFNGQVLSGYMDFPASDTPAVASIQLKITEEMQKRNTTFYMQINSSVEAHVKLYAAKVELGPQQTLAHQDADGNWVLNDPPPNKALELAKCQRYFRLIKGPTYLVGIRGFSKSTDIEVPIIGAAMRVAPTPVIRKLSNIVATDGTSLADVSSASIGTKDCFVLITENNSLHRGPIAIYCNDDIWLDSNL